MKTLEILKKKSAILPASLLNNIGTLHYLKGDLTQSGKYLDVAIKLASEQAELDSDIMRYNKARVLEPSAESKAIYEELALTGKFPEGRSEHLNQSIPSDSISTIAIGGDEARRFKNCYKAIPGYSKSVLW